MFGIVVARRGEKMKISDLYSDVVSEDLKYEYKAELNPDNPVNLNSQEFFSLHPSAIAVGM